MQPNLFKFTARFESYVGVGVILESWNRLHLVLGPLRLTVAIWSY